MLVGVTSIHTYLIFFFIRQELQYQSSLKKKERLPNDRFVETVGSFVKVSNFSLQEAEEIYKEMEERVSVNTLFQSLGIEPRSQNSNPTFVTIIPWEDDNLPGMFKTNLIMFLMMLML